MLHKVGSRYELNIYGTKYSDRLLSSLSDQGGNFFFSRHKDKYYFIFTPSNSASK